MKHFSPRTWLHSLYSQQTKTESQQTILTRRKSVKSYSKQNNKGQCSKSYDQLKIGGNKSIKNKQQRRQLNNTKVKQPFMQNQKEQFFRQLFKKSDSEKLLFPPQRQTEVIDMKKQIVAKRLSHCDQAPNKQSRLIKKIRINPQSTPVAQIILTQNNTTLTSDLKTKQSKQRLITQSLCQSQYQSQCHSMSQSNLSSSCKMKTGPSLPMLLRKQKTKNQNLQTIREETLEHIRANSSTFRTPRQISDHLLVSIVQKTNTITEQQSNRLKSSQSERQKSDDNLLKSQEQIVQSPLNTSPVKNYQCSISIPIVQSLQKTQSVKQVCLTQLKELYLEQFKKQETHSRNLTDSISRQLEAGLALNTRIQTFQNQAVTSLDRLSPIPMQESRKHYPMYQSIKSQNSVDRQQYPNSSKFKIIKVENRLLSSEVFGFAADKIDTEQYKSIKKLRIHRKPQATPLTRSRDNKAQRQGSNSGKKLLSSRINKPQNQVFNFNYGSLRAVCNNDNNNSLSTPRLKISTQYMSARLTTDRSRKGISLSRKSEQKILRRSLQKKIVQSIKVTHANDTKQNSKPKEFVRLGNRISIKMKDEGKVGIKVLSQESQRLKSRENRPKIK